MLVLLIFLTFILYNEWPLLKGKKVILATKPIDSFDTFGGHININYEISTINNVTGFKIRDSIYITLKKDKKGIWRLEKTSKIKPNKEIFIKGKVTWANNNAVKVKRVLNNFSLKKTQKFQQPT
ncbi:MAG: GDYXXLXY domain-containing protein [Candidatus Pacearchaeota archaeon]